MRSWSLSRKDGCSAPQTTPDGEKKEHAENSEIKDQSIQVAFAHLIERIELRRKAHHEFGDLSFNVLLGIPA
jgi:hypothetical protein